MTSIPRTLAIFAGVAILLILTGVIQSWNSALLILNMGLVSALMSLGLNLQWGYGGLLNVGVMGFVALGGLATVIVSMPPVTEAWAAGGLRTMAGLVVAAATIAGAMLVWRRMARGKARLAVVTAMVVVGLIVYRWLLIPGTAAIEAVNASSTGYLGGLGLPVLLAWPVGGLLAAGAGWLIGKTALGLRADYLAIATLGISEIVIAVLKNEDWLSRGVKNVIGLPRPVPNEIDLQNDPGFADAAAGVGLDAVTASTLFVKANYSVLLAGVLVIAVIATQLALHSPWGRMMRAIRDNDTAAAAMGKDVKARHLQVFVLGAALMGLAGAMMTTLDGQLTPGAYTPLRYTFLIWVMVIVGGSGNNLGSVVGGILVWWMWVQAEPISQTVLGVVTAPLPEGNAVREHLLDSAAYMRLLSMGVLLLLVLRFSPRGLLPGR